MPTDIEKLKTSIPGSVYDMLKNSILNDYNIDTNLKLAHFLAQCNYESGGFKFAEENMNYSAERLLVIFKKYFPDEATAKLYAGKPEKIANRVYASRFGNGDEASGDGWKYRGRGYIQLTFKANYQVYSDARGIDVVTDPDKVKTVFPLDSAAYFFKKNKLFEKCTDATLATAEKITNTVSGTTATAAKRYKMFQDFYAKLTTGI